MTKEQALERIRALDAERAELALVVRLTSAEADAQWRSLHPKHDPSPGSYVVDPAGDWCFWLETQRTVPGRPEIIPYVKWGYDV